MCVSCPLLVDWTWFVQKEGQVIFGGLSATLSLTRYDCAALEGLKLAFSSIPHLGLVRLGLSSSL